MNKSDAQRLQGLVGSKANMDDLTFYMEHRISIIKDRLIGVKNWEEVLRFQGAIDELSRLKSLREEVLNPRES
jgi:hypothetical protein